MIEKEEEANLVGMVVVEVAMGVAMVVVWVAMVVVWVSKAVVWVVHCHLSLPWPLTASPSPPLLGVTL